MGFYPAVRRLMKEHAEDWPATYEGELFRARGSSGKLAFQTKIFPANLVPYLGEAIRQELMAKGIDWGASIVFLHQIRGVKSATRHNLDMSVNLTATAQEAFKNFLEKYSLPFGVVNSPNWWIDVGLEISSYEQCLAWRTDGQAEVIRWLLGLRQDQAQELTSIRCTQYTRDMTSHLPNLSGCRISPGSRRRGPLEARYVQLYLTDKSVTARPDNHRHAKYLSGQAILSGTAEPYLAELYELYRSSIQTVRSHARVEIRLPIAHALKPLLDFGPQLAKKTLVAFTPNTWWYVLSIEAYQFFSNWSYRSLRAYRLLAFRMILSEQEKAPGKSRATKNALILTAFAPWFLNSLHSTPDLGPSSREILTRVLPHMRRQDAMKDQLENQLPFLMSLGQSQMGGGQDNSDHDDYDTESSSGEGHPNAVAAGADTVPVIMHGLVFIRAIHLGPDGEAPGIPTSNQQFLKAKTIQYIFGKELDEVISILLGNTCISKPNPNRVRNKVRTALYIHRDDGEILFNLENQPSSAGDPQTTSGLHSSSLRSHLMTNRGLSEKVTIIWNQFMKDITAKAPNMQGGAKPSYCKLNSEQRSSVDELTYQNPVLSDYFLACQWKVGTEKDWRISFNYLWPTKGDTKAKRQNYATCRYHQLWGEITEEFDEKTVKLARDAILLRYNSLFWLPQAYSDRIWWTKRDAQTYTLDGYGNTGPRVLVRSNPTWRGD